MSAPNRILILDTETTGLDPAVDRVIEIGAVLWSVEHATTLAFWTTIVQGDTNAAEAVNGIPAASLTHGMPREKADRIVFGMVEQADAIIAHNAEFDRSFLPTLPKPWICSKNDIEWPRAATGTSLVALCLAHGLGVSHAHRALTDCLLIARLLERVHEMGHDVGAMLARGLRPKSRYVALVSYDDREKAKAAGFGWDGATKTWSRTMADEDAAKLPFGVRRVA